jgi:sugar/nucleoside kinase (ribokinase family)
MIDGQDLLPVAGDVLDTTGAGDALAAGYLVGGAELAMDAAARCVAQIGTMP